MRQSVEDGVEKMTACPLGLAGQCYCANRVSSFAAADQSLERSTKTAVLLLAHGSPENPDQVPEFLSYVTGGRPLPPPVVEEIRHRYSLIGFSPLPCWTLLQADQLSQSLHMAVFVGMRNWKPFIADAVKAIASQGYERVIAICLAPQNSRTSVGLYRSAVSWRARSFLSNWISSMSGTTSRCLPERLRKNCAWAGRRHAPKTEQAARDLHRPQRSRSARLPKVIPTSGNPRKPPSWWRKKPASELATGPSRSKARACRAVRGLVRP